MITLVKDPNLGSGEDSLRTRSSMLVRLRDTKDDVTWSDFYLRYRPLVLGFALKLGLTREEAEEVCQDVFSEVSSKINEFVPDRTRGKFRSWLFQRTDWRVRDKFRARSRRIPDCANFAGDDTTESSPADRIPVESELESVWDAEWERNRVETALSRLARKVPAKKFQAFELHAIRQWPVHEVAKALGMNPATICVNTHRLRKLMKRELESLQD